MCSVLCCQVDTFPREYKCHNFHMATMSPTWAIWWRLTLQKRKAIIHIRISNICTKVSSLYTAMRKLYIYTLTPAGIYVYSRPIYKCGVYILHYRLMLKGIRRKKTIYRVDTRASLISVSSVNSHHLISKYILAECIYIQHRRSENTSSSTIRHWSRHTHSPCHSPLVS